NMKRGFADTVKAWGKSGLGAAALALAGLGAGSQAWALTLNEAYRAALASDPVFAAARASYSASVEQLPQAKANLLPWITASGDLSYADTRTRFTNQLPRRNNYNDSFGY